MLAVPVIVNLILGFFLPEIPKAILTLIIGLPAMTTVAMVVQTYDSDVEFATEPVKYLTI